MSISIFMPKATMTLQAWKCLRCSHVWPDKREKKPIRCPACGSPYWDMPIVNKKREVEEDKDGTTNN